MSFGKSKDESNDRAANTAFSTSAHNGSASPDAVLGKGSKVVGALTFTGTAEIDGEVEGELSAKEKLLIGEAAIIKAKVRGAEIIVRGEVTGDIDATRLLALKKPARVYGNISAPVISIEEGVIFEGKCSMTQSTATSAATISRPAEIKVTENRPVSAK